MINRFPSDTYIHYGHIDIGQLDWLAGRFEMAGILPQLPG